jgi:hypothetical protein
VGSGAIVQVKLKGLSECDIGVELGDMVESKLGGTVNLEAKLGIRVQVVSSTKLNRAL